MTTSWPDMAYAIGFITRHNHDPSNDHIVAVKRVFLYLSGKKDWHLDFWGEGVLKCYVDSDCAECPDDYRLTSELVITFRGVVDWQSRKQMFTTQFTNDTTYDSLGVGCMRVSQMSHLLNELAILSTPPVFTNSQTLMASIRFRIYCWTALVHVETKYWLAADMARDEEINLCYVPTANMLTDCFTKPLPKSPWVR